MQLFHHRLMYCFVVLSLLLFLSACSTAAIDARVNYWKAETTAHLPEGASKRQAEEFFAARGAQLKCCVSMPPEKKYYFVSERKVGPGLVMEYDVVVLLELSASDRVMSVSVQTWGVGF